MSYVIDQKVSFTVYLVPTPPPAVGYTVVIHVYDEEGNPIEGASVTLNTFSGTTDENGGVIFEDVPEGEYTLTVEKEGYEKYEEKVKIEENVSIDVTLVKVKPPAIPKELLYLIAGAGVVGGALLLTRKRK